METKWITRTVTQAKIFYLVMNPVTDRTEVGRITMMSEDKEKLIKAYESEFVDTYDDDRFRKVFRKGGPLEWYNPLFTLEAQSDPYGHGLREEWIDLGEVAHLRSKYFFV